MTSSAPTARFGDRVGTYARARPGYPAGVVELLRSRAGLGPGCVVADVGAGTGIFTRLLLDAGAMVHAVEPNGPMRDRLTVDTEHTSLTVHAAPAEATGLPTAGIDLITAAQAFHWFDLERVGLEFRRMLWPGGAVALIWNDRVAATPFLVGYETLVRRWAMDYQQVDHRQVTTEMIEGFFAPGPVGLHQFDHRQMLDRAGVRDRLLSSSYAPPPGHPDHEPMLAELSGLFDRCAESQTIPFVYRTDVYLGGFG
jgi:SAM-dependent methyltransferase